VERKAVDFKEISLDQVLQDVAHDLEILIEENNATVQIGSLPVIQADESMIRQLFENLVNNAIKYARDGVNPVIKVSSRQTAKTIDVFVEDNGIGFDPKYLPQMFTLFQRLHSSEKYKGTGLGLAICQKIVALHNGSITATSKPGEGSIFRVSFPVQHSVKHERA
jgi:light-regulated signal transduction histidine kinase (bacteriophytochrome)